jgi:hypothetical protein
MLPVSKVKMPACLAGARNGQLRPGLLVECGIGSFKMVPPAARAMKALVAAAEAELGIDVWATGTYRTLEQQVSLFLQRYTRTPQPGRRHEVWQGQDYWLKPRVAGAARPGTSNHGLGLAVDFAEKKNGKVVSISTRFVTWLCKHAIEFGFSAEDQSENWHWRYVAGDAVPAGVTSFEDAQKNARPARTPNPPVAKEAPTPPATPVLRIGATGQAVQHMQLLLQANGFYLAKNCDGRFGPRTLAALVEFQRSRGLATDGVCGPKTWKELLK